MDNQLSAKSVAIVGTRLFGLYALWKAISALFSWLNFVALDANVKATAPEGYLAKAAVFSLAQVAVGLAIGVLFV